MPNPSHKPNERTRLIVETMTAFRIPEIETAIMVGFVSVECVWRWMNFAGWIAVK